MTAGAYDPYLNKRMDYTFTGTIQPMKLVFFDLAPYVAHRSFGLRQPLRPFRASTTPTR